MTPALRTLIALLTEQVVDEIMGKAEEPAAGPSLPSYQELYAIYKLPTRRQMRTAAERRATPRWRDKKAIADIYHRAWILTCQTGVPHCVDHIIPLRGYDVCGLHVHNNLQVITTIENSKKGNIFIPIEGEAWT